MHLGLVRALGWVVIAHGLSHAVLPLRGSLAPAIAINDWMPAGLYVTATIGFTIAGLGMLGLRPLDRAISPLLVLASGVSLVAIWRFGAFDLWPGMALDVILLPIGLWRGYAGWPAHPSHGPVWHALGLAVGFAFVAYVGTSSLLWPWHRTWGSTRDEILMALPGDPPMRNPAYEVQHAVTIDVSPQAVWPWLVQLGQDRGGFYTYLGGLLRSDLGWTVLDLEEGRALVLQGWGTFALRPTGDGRTRFIIRTRVGNPAIPVWAAGLDFMTFHLPHFIMQRRMMLTIKALAERHGALEAQARPKEGL